MYGIAYVHAAVLWQHRRAWLNICAYMQPQNWRNTVREKLTSNEHPKWLCSRVDTFCLSHNLLYMSSLPAERPPRHTVICASQHLESWIPVSVLSSSYDRWSLPVRRDKSNCKCLWKVSARACLQKVAGLFRGVSSKCSETGQASTFNHTHVFLFWVQCYCSLSMLSLEMFLFNIIRESACNWFCTTF